MANVLPCSRVGGRHVTNRFGWRVAQEGQRGVHRARNVAEADRTTQEETDSLLVRTVEYGWRRSSRATCLDAERERWKSLEIDRLEGER